MGASDYLGTAEELYKETLIRRVFEVGPDTHDLFRVVTAAQEFQYIRVVLVGRTGEYLSKRASSPIGRPSRSPTHGALVRYGA